MDGQDAHPTRNLLFVEQAGKPVAEMVRDVSYGAFYGRAGCPPTRNLLFVEQAGKPVAEIVRDVSYGVLKVNS